MNKAAITLRLNDDLSNKMDSFLDKNKLFNKSLVVRMALNAFFEENRAPRTKPKSKPPIVKNFTEDEFERFWLEWPRNERKVNKKGCYAKFMKISGVEFSEILRSLQAQKKSESWLNGFAPQPMTWINQERWNVKPPKSTKEQFLESVS